MNGCDAFASLVIHSRVELESRPVEANVGLTDHQASVGRGKPLLVRNDCVGGCPGRFRLGCKEPILAIQLAINGVPLTIVKDGNAGFQAETMQAARSRLNLLELVGLIRGPNRDKFSCRTNVAIVDCRSSDQKNVIGAYLEQRRLIHQSECWNPGHRPACHRRFR